MSYRKSRETFTKKLEMGKKAVKLIMDLLEKQAHEIYINPDVCQDVWDTPSKKRRWKLADIYDHTDDQLIEVTSTNSDSIFIGPQRLQAWVENEVLIYYVFWKISPHPEIRRIEAVSLMAQKNHAYRRQNRYGEPVLIFPRKTAELVKDEL